MFRIIRPVSVFDAQLTSSNVPETDGTAGAWDVGTPYTAGQTVRYVVANVHLVYECAANNTGVTPGTDATKWTLIGSTNRWKMFDGSVGSQTENADSIVVTLTAASRITDLSLHNVSGASVRVVMTDAVDGVVYDQTQSLISDSGITDPYAYSFEPIVRKTDVAFTEMPPYANAAITVTITDTGATAKCGELVFGMGRDLGYTLMGASIGIQDFSTKEPDAFGGYEIVERAYAKTGTFPIIVVAGFVDELQNLMAAYRATKIVYIGSSLYGSTILLGFYRDFNVEIRYFDKSICTLEIEAVT